MDGTKNDLFLHPKSASGKNDANITVAFQSKVANTGVHFRKSRVCLVNAIKSARNVEIVATTMKTNAVSDVTLWPVGVFSLKMTTAEYCCYSGFVWVSVFNRSCQIQLKARIRWIYI